MDREVRYLAGAGVEVRAADGKATGIRGYAAKFDVLSENLGGFREQIKPGAFADVLEDDVRALLNHDPNFVLGRTLSGTARIGQDDTGLWYEVDMPDTQTARDLMELIRRGDVSQSSFAFRVAPDGDSWDEDAETGAVIRSITKFGRLYDVSPVTYPAYPDATVGTRALEQFRDRKTEEQRKHDAAEAARRVAQKRANQARLERLKTPA